MFKYKHKKTGEVVERDKPLTGAEKKDYVLVEWRKNLKIKSDEIIKK